MIILKFPLLKSHVLWSVSLFSLFCHSSSPSNFSFYSLCDKVNVQHSESIPRFMQLMPIFRIWASGPHSHHGLLLLIAYRFFWFPIDLYLNVIFPKSHHPPWDKWLSLLSPYFQSTTITLFILLDRNLGLSSLA